MAKTSASSRKACPICATPFSGRSLSKYDSHVKACRNKKKARSGAKKAGRASLQKDSRHILSARRTQADTPGDIAMKNPALQGVQDGLGLGDKGGSDNEGSIEGPELPSVYILIRPHEHGHLSEGLSLTIIPLDLSCISLNPTAPPELKHTDIPAMAKAYHTFAILANFKIAELASKCGMERDDVNMLLKGLGGRWAEKNKSTFTSYKDLNDALECAHEYVIPVCPFAVLLQSSIQ